MSLCGRNEDSKMQFKLKLIQQRNSGCTVTQTWSRDWSQKMAGSATGSRKREPHQ